VRTGPVLSPPGEPTPLDGRPGLGKQIMSRRDLTEDEKKLVEWQLKYLATDAGVSERDLDTVISIES